MVAKYFLISAVPLVIFSSIASSQDVGLIDELRVIKEKLSSLVLTVESQDKKIKSLEKKLKPEKWPHAINCGGRWDAMYVLHGKPKDNSNTNSPVSYHQIFAAQVREVKFNSSDGSYLEGSGNEESRRACIGKSIMQLREEKKTFQFVRE